jgi:ABC-type transport system involved in cytochrome c biogenesis permease subunit
MIHTAALISISLYIVGALLFMFQMWRPSRTGRLKGGAFACSVLALLSHSATVVFVLRDPRFIALQNGADYFLWVSWLLALVFIVCRRWFDYPMLGVFITSSIVLFMGSSSYLLHQESDSLVNPARLNGSEGVLVSLLHGIPALVSVVSLVLALGVSVVFLVVERRIKQRSSLSLEVRGISLQLLDRLNTHLVRIGFVAISLVVFSGGLWAVIERKSVFTADTSVLSGLIVWVSLAAILFVRLVLNWSPKKISRLTVVVAGSFLLSVFTALMLSGRASHVVIWS